MEHNKALLEELLNKQILVKSQGGVGTKGDMLVGDYNCVLLSYDDNFIKVEYEFSRYVDGANRVSKSILLINIAYIISIEEYMKKESEFSFEK